MKIMVISPRNKTVFNFRGDLIKDFVRLGHSVVVTGPNDEYMKEIKELGADFVQIPFVKDNVGIKGDIEYCKKLIAAIKKEKPDKVFSYTIKPVIYGSIAARKCGIKEIYPMVTGLGRVYASDSFKIKILRMITGILYKYALKGCKKVIFQNWDDLNLFVKKRYIKKEQGIKVDGSGVNMEHFELSSLPEEKTFLMIAKIIKEKGVMQFCEAAEIVKKKYPDAKFTILGGTDKSYGAIKVEDLSKYTDSKIVEIPGEVKDVRPMLYGCYAMVLPTFYREGIPRSILEAMACGKPVITTDWVGTKEAVENGKNGYLVPIKDSEALAEAMIKLIENPDVAKEMGKAGYEICKERFEISIINKQMIEIMNL